MNNLWATRVAMPVAGLMIAHQVASKAVRDATFLDAWKYADQVEVWSAVHPSKIGAWSLLVTMSFVLVATIKAQEGRLYHSPPRDVTQQRPDPVHTATVDRPPVR